MEELDNVVGTRRLIQESDIPKLDYVKASAKEAYRHHPISDFNVICEDASCLHLEYAIRLF